MLPLLLLYVSLLLSSLPLLLVLGAPLTPGEANEAPVPLLLLFAVLLLLSTLLLLLVLLGGVALEPGVARHCPSCFRCVPCCRFFCAVGRGLGVGLSTRSPQTITIKSS